MRPFFRTSLINVLVACILFFSFSIAEEQRLEMFQEEVLSELLMPLEIIIEAEIEEVFDNNLENEEDEVPYFIENIDLDCENQAELGLTRFTHDEQPDLFESTSTQFKRTQSDVFYDIESDSETIDELELPLVIRDDPTAIEESVLTEIPTKPTRPDSDSGFNSANDKADYLQTPDNEILTVLTPEKVEHSHVSNRSISPEDISTSVYISKLVLARQSNAYKAVKDMELVLTIINCSDKTIRVKANIRIDAAVTEMYEVLGLAVPLQSKDIILGAGEEQRMTWTFICHPGLISSVSTASPGEMNLAFQLDLSYEWNNIT